MQLRASSSYFESARVLQRTSVTREEETPGRLEERKERVRGNRRRKSWKGREKQRERRATTSNDEKWMYEGNWKGTDDDDDDEEEEKKKKKKKKE